MAKRVSEAWNRFVDLTVVPTVLPAVQRGLLPDAVIRAGIRSMLRDLLAEFAARGAEGRMAAKQAFIAELKALPIAVETQAANDQHYQSIPTEFYKLVLGPCMKYSCGLWPEGGKTSFEESERAMLELYCERAELADGMKLLDLGCGWGSVSLYVAAKYPTMRITSVSNSATQREYIEGEAKKRGLSNITVITADINSFEAPATDFDRVISIEMFEHMKNYQKLMGKISGWLKPGGKLFVHIFTHATTPYHFKEGWMADNFFTGGQMPSEDLLLYFQDDLRIEAQWTVDGKHYSRTNAAWLANLDRNEKEAKAILTRIYGADKTTKAFFDWRIFFLTLVECFALDDGTQWAVSLYRFVKPGGSY